ncbi:unnamed protein product [Camellia sinensis]
MKCRDRLHELVKEEIEKKDSSTEEWKIAMESSFNHMDNEVIAWNDRFIFCSVQIFFFSSSSSLFCPDLSSSSIHFFFPNFFILFLYSKRRTKTIIFHFFSRFLFCPDFFLFCPDFCFLFFHFFFSRFLYSSLAANQEQIDLIQICFSF